MKCSVRFCRKKPLAGRKTCQRCRLRAWRAANPLKAAYYTHRSHANERGIETHLTIEQFTELIEGTAYLTEPGNFQIDRINHKLPYQSGNVRIIPALENKRKGGLERWGLWVVDHNEFAFGVSNA
jgi:hypothetical protein